MMERKMKMATVTQIYDIVNNVAAQALGSQAIAAVDTGSLVSLGNQVFSTDDDVEQFYKALCDVIGLTIVAVRAYEAQTRSNFREGMDWGCIMQKISFHNSIATENPTWEAGKQQSPFDVEGTITAKQKLFSKISTWSNEEVIPDWQLKTAFHNANAMAAFIDGIFVTMRNSMELELERIAALATNTNIAGCLLSDNPVLSRDLLREYNLKRGLVDDDNVTVAGQTPLTMDTALMDMGFLKYASRQINLVRRNMRSFSKIFNAEGQERHTPNDKVVLEVLNEYASASEVYLQADTFHNELTSLPMYEVVSYWQGSGTTFDFENCSTINITNAALATSENPTGTIEKSGIIAFIHDVDSCASTMYDRRMRSTYNERSEVNIYMEKATVGYAVDMSENAVVFYMTNPQAAQKE